MDADGPALLGQTNNVLLDILAGGHHQVGDFVGHDDDVRQVQRDAGPLFVVFDLQPVEQLLFAELVVDGDVSYPGPGQQMVTLLHLLDRPGQNRLGLLHVGHDRVHQVRQLSVGA